LTAFFDFAMYYVTRNIVILTKIRQVT